MKDPKIGGKLKIVQGMELAFFFKNDKKAQKTLWETGDSQTKYRSFAMLDSLPLGRCFKMGPEDSVDWGYTVSTTPVWIKRDRTNVKRIGTQDGSVTTHLSNRKNGKNRILSPKL